MKKSLIALAALATTGAAFSQSTATLYGQVDAALTTAKGNGITRTGLWNAGLGSSLLGFTGSEDLGGGLKGNFKIEGGLNMDSGVGTSSNTNNQPTGGFTTQSGTTAAPTINSATATNPATRASAGGSQGLVFQRYAYLGLSGGFGEVRLGRDYAASFWNFTRFDPFGTNGVAASSSLTLYLGGANSIATTTNISNSIGYISPNISGFQLQAQVGYGENNSTGTAAGLNANKAGNLTSLNATYAAGPISLAVGSGTTKGTAVASGVGIAAIPGDYTQSSIAGSYNFGVARVMAYRGTEKLQTATATATPLLKNTSTLLGVVVPMGAVNLKASYVTAEYTNAGAKVDKGTLLGLGADYSFSKRTAAYVAYTKVKNDTSTSYGIGSGAGRIVGTAAAGSATGMAAGLRHSF
jgi:predicted porin